MPLDRSSRRAILALLAVAGLSVVLNRAFEGFDPVRTDGGDAGAAGDAEPIPLPAPSEGGDVSVEDPIAIRRSRREFGDGPTGDVQSELRATAVDLVVCAVDERTTRKYGERGRLRYVPMEAGDIGENPHLQVEALGLSTVSIGAFHDDRVWTLVDAPTDRRPLYVFPVGERAR